MADDSNPQWSKQPTLDWRLDPKESFSDYIIVLRDDDGTTEEFHVHKCILALGSRSSGYFAQMFTSDDEEVASSTSSIHLVNRNLIQAFPLFLDFVYQCRPVEANSAEFHLVPLRYLSTYFDVQILFEFTTEIMMTGKLSESSPNYTFGNFHDARSVMDSLHTSLSGFCVAMEKPAALEPFRFGDSRPNLSSESYEEDNHEPFQFGSVETSKSEGQPGASINRKPPLEDAQLYIRFMVEADMFGDDEIYNLACDCLAPLCCAEEVSLRDLPTSSLLSLPLSKTFERKSSNKWVENVIDYLENVDTGEEYLTKDDMWTLFGSLANLEGATSLNLLEYLLSVDYVPQYVVDNEDCPLQAKILKDISAGWNESMDMSSLPIEMTAYIYRKALLQKNSGDVSEGSSFQFSLHSGLLDV